MNNRRYVALIIPVILLALTGCSDGPPEHFTGSGTIEATEYMVSAVTGGRILDLMVDEGMRVAGNDTVAVLDLETLRLQRKATAAGLDELDWNARVLDREKATAEEQITQATARLDNAERTLERIRGLNRSNAATQEHLDRTETETEIARSQLAQTKKQLETLQTRKQSLAATREKIEANLALFDRQIEDGVVLAPHEGIVLETFTETGEVTAPGKPICSIGYLGEVWLTIYVGEADLGNLSIGQDAGITIDSHPDRTFDGTVTWISETAEFTPKNVQTKDSRLDLVYAVKITLPNPDGIFKIGMPADAYIEGL